MFAEILMSYSWKCAVIWPLIFGALAFGALHVATTCFEHVWLIRVCWALSKQNVTFIAFAPCPMSDNEFVRFMAGVLH